MGNFDESKVNRDSDGKFAPKGTNAEKERFNELIGAREKLIATVKAIATKRSTDELNRFIGKEYIGFKGQDAINKLLKEKQGHIKAAFYRDDIGGIDLVWGDDNCGLRHIIKRREEQGINANEFLNGIADVVENGTYQGVNERGRLEFYLNKRL